MSDLQDRYDIAQVIIRYAPRSISATLSATARVSPRTSR